MRSLRLWAQLGLVASAVVLFASVTVLLQGRQGFTPRIDRSALIAPPVRSPVVMNASTAHVNRP